MRPVPGYDMRGTTMPLPIFRRPGPGMKMSVTMKQIQYMCINAM
jgi:hypothetical protein